MYVLVVILWLPYVIYTKLHVVYNVWWTGAYQTTWKCHMGDSTRRNSVSHNPPVCSDPCLAAAKCTVLVIQLFLTNCVQAHDNLLEVLRRIDLYLSTRRPRTIWYPGHAGTRFFEISYFQEFCLSRPRNFSKNRGKIIKKNLAGLRPAPLPYGAAPLPPNKVGAKCLAAVVLDNPDRALCPASWASSWTFKQYDLSKSLILA